MSTSHRNVRRSLAWTGSSRLGSSPIGLSPIGMSLIGLSLRGLSLKGLWLIGCALLASPGVQAASAADAAALNAKLIQAAKKDEQLPQEQATATLVGSPVAADASSGRQLVSFTLRYKGLSNRYCRLAVVDAESNASLVALPPEALPDDCARLAPVYTADLDGDGVQDVVHALSVPTQAGGGTVQQAAVYLSRGPGTPAGFCYAGALSAQLGPADLVSRAKLLEAIQRIRQRLGADALKC